LSPKDQHGRKQSAWRPCRVGQPPESESYQKYTADKHHTVASGKRVLLRDGVTPTDQWGGIYSLDTGRVTLNT
jgi:hypothetical protein